MKIPQTLALRGLMQRLGFAFLVCTLVIGATGSASAGEARDEAAVRALGDSFAKAFIQKNAELRASLFEENGTFVTPQGDYLQGRVAMVKDFGPEAQQAVNATTQAAFTNYRILPVVLRPFLKRRFEVTKLLGARGDQQNALPTEVPARYIER
jgi:hypothetical protein